jgi:hypothetical protein
MKAERKKLKDKNCGAETKFSKFSLDSAHAFYFHFFFIARLKL